MKASLLSKAGEVIASLDIETAEYGAYHGTWQGSQVSQKLIDLSHQYMDELADNLLFHASETMRKIRECGFQIQMVDGHVIQPPVLTVFADGEMWFRPDIPSPPPVGMEA